MTSTLPHYMRKKTNYSILWKLLEIIAIIPLDRTLWIIAKNYLKLSHKISADNLS